MAIPNPNRFPSDAFFEEKPPPFHPYVFIKTDRRNPSSIAMAAVAGGGMKYINLHTKSPELAKVKELVQKNFGDNRGQCALFGKVEGYLLVLTPTEGIVLDVEGNEVKRITGSFWPQSTIIQDQLN
jgi:hypothetical protein